MGFDKESSMVEYAADHGIISGRNPYSYLKSHPDIKFSTKNIHKAMEEHPDLYRWILEDSAPVLAKLLSTSPMNPQKDMAMDKLDELLTESYAIADMDKEEIAG
jgi:hypothetical protein